MNHPLRNLGVALAGVALSLAACERDSVRTDESPVTARRTEATAAVETTPTTAIDPALARLAEARCDREMRCQNIGQGREYENRAACIRDVRTSHADDVNRSECPAGVDQRELAECMEEVRNEDCNNPLDTVGRLVACRSSDLCRHI
ncbi:MAG: DUF6184 family natural product biosynthesis lipoprotein [Polyangiales bacterium]